MFFLGVNVYGWETFGIDYKKIFEIELHYSSSFKVMKRAFGFIAIWLVFFCYCALSSSDLFKNSWLFNQTIAMYIAPVPTFLFIFYMIFPATSMFNYEGRMWTFGLMKSIIKEPLTQLCFSFKTGFAYDQMMSFMIVINDFVYTLCYMENVYNTNQVPNLCLKFRFRIKQFAIIFAICFWGTFVKFTNYIRVNLNKKNYSVEKDFLRDLASARLSLAKSCAISFTSVVGFFNYKDDVLNATWICYTIIVTCWVTHDDFVHAWGFFQTKDWLRKKIAYPNKSVYYLAMLSNVILRLTWVVSLAPGLFEHPLLNNLLPLIMSIFECFRRMIYNFFTVEYEHINRMGNTKLVSEYDLPYDLDIDMTNDDVKGIVDKQVGIFLRGAFLKKDSIDVKDDDEMRKSKVIQGKMVSNEGSFREMIIKNEDEHKEEMAHYDDVLEKCRQFLEKDQVKNLGKGKVNLDVHIIEEAGAATDVGETDKAQIQLFQEIASMKKGLVVKSK